VSGSEWEDVELDTTCQTNLVILRVGAVVSGDICLWAAVLRQRDFGTIGHTRAVGALAQRISGSCLDLSAASTRALLAAVRRRGPRKSAFRAPTRVIERADTVGSHPLPPSAITRSRGNNRRQAHECRHQRRASHGLLGNAGALTACTCAVSGSHKKKRAFSQVKSSQVIQNPRSVSGIGKIQHDENSKARKVFD
jgi:hypothetical protein